MRTVSDDGGVSYIGFDFQECLPVLHSMIKFPPSSAGIDTQTIVWKALSRAGKHLTPETFLNSLNLEFSKVLSAREIDYFVLTSMSIDPAGFPRSFKIQQCRIYFLRTGYQRKFKSRQAVVNAHRISIPETPDSYVKVVVKARAKSERMAFHKAMRAVDLQRAILCMMANSTMQFSAFGPQSVDPINAIRLGGKHTTHLEGGEIVGDELWYEPGFVPAKPHRFKNPDIVAKNLRWALRRIDSSRINNSITSALIRFVRALDHSDPNTAFLRLWGALECLTTPGIADYDKLIRRTAFLFREHGYHRQVLEHLREYRNANVHAGEESDNAKIHCFQLQMYFVSVAWFFIRNAIRFSSVDDAGEFLDLPPERSALRHRLALVRGALKFTAPREG